MDTENVSTSHDTTVSLTSVSDGPYVVLIDDEQYQSIIAYPQPIDYTVQLDKLNNSLVGICNLILLIFLFGVGKVVYNTLVKTF